MGKYILRRLVIALPSLLGISLILFVLLALAPGDPFGELANNSNIPPEVRAALTTAIKNVESRLAWGERLGVVFTGLSLGSILFLVALGLAARRLTDLGGGLIRR